VYLHRLRGTGDEGGRDAAKRCGMDIRCSNPPKDVDQRSETKDEQCALCQTACDFMRHMVTAGGSSVNSSTVRPFDRSTANVRVRSEEKI
jgi:hypothetical protein